MTYSSSRDSVSLKINDCAEWGDTVTHYSLLRCGRRKRHIGVCLFPGILTATVQSHVLHNIDDIFEYFFQLLTTIKSLKRHTRHLYLFIESKRIHNAPNF